MKKNILKNVLYIKDFPCISFILLTFLLLSCSSQKLTEQKDLSVITANGKNICIHAEIARTSEDQAYGFMNRKKIPEGTGMLFVFKTDQFLHFWMKNTPTALSIAYIDSNGYIRNIFDMEPLSLSTISSTVSVRYALEVPQGWFNKVHIKKGDRLVLNF